MDQQFKRFVDTGMSKAAKLGVSDVEFFIMKHKAMELEVKQGKLQDSKLAEGQGIGVRVLKDKRQGFSYSTDFSTTALDKMLHQAVINAGYNDRDEANHFPAPGPGYRDMALYDATLEQRSLADKEQLAVQTEQTALAADKRVVRIERAGYEEGETEIWLANSNGLSGYQRGSYCGVYALALGSDGQAQESGSASDISIFYDELSPEKAGRLTAERAVRLLGAKPVQTQAADLVLDPYITMQMMSIVAAAFSGEAVLKGRSLFKDKLGEAVASPLVTLVDDGTLADRLGSAPFDGEGVSCQRTVLVEQGILKNFLYDSHAARQAGTVSTGNGLRGSYKGTPSIQTTNYYLAAGELTQAQLIGQVSAGLYVTEILGAHTVNAISGDFSLGAAGIWIENGRLTRPVRGVTIAGNLKELLLGITAVADDLTFHGSVGAPTICVGPMTISGE